MVVAREVPLPHHLHHPRAWAVVDLSRRQSIPADRSFGSAVPLGQGHVVTWRVSGVDGRQCLQLMELSTTTHLADNRVVLYLPEAIVNVKCFSTSEQLVLLIVTVSGIRMAWLPISSPDQSDRATISVLNMQNPLSDTAYVAKEGMQILSGDARLREDDSLEIFLGTSGGQTLSLHATNYKVSARAELRQASSGFSLFRSPSKSVGSGQRVCDVCLAGNDHLLTISEDGKVKKWLLSSGKCLVERVVKLEPKGLYASRAAVMQDADVVVLMLKAENSPETALTWCRLDRLGDFRPEKNELDVQRNMDNEQVLGSETTLQELTGLFAVTMRGEKDEEGETADREVLCTVWQDVDASVVCLSTMEDNDGWSTSVLYSTSWELQSQLELANLYLDKWDVEVEVDEELGVVMPHAANHFEDLVLGPRRFPGGVLLSGLSELMHNYGRQPPQAQPHLLASGEQAIRLHVKDKMTELLDATGMAARERAAAWSHLFECCLQIWRAEYDVCVGVAEVQGCCFSDVMLIKRSGLSLLRTPCAGSTEEQFHCSMNEEDIEEEQQYTEALGDARTSALWLGYRMLLWAEAADPGGFVFSRMLMEEAPLAAVQSMVHLVLQQSEHQHPTCDPEYVLGKYPALFQLGEEGIETALCQSLQTQLAHLQGFHSSARQQQQCPPPAPWLTSVLERACEQVVGCHFEAVRSFALLLSLLENHRVATACHQSTALQVALRQRVAPLLVEYHTLRWSGTRRMLRQPDDQQPEQTLLAYSVEAPAFAAGLAAEAAPNSSLLSFVTEPFQSSSTSIAEPISSLVLRLFRDLHESMQTGASPEVAQQWGDLLALTSMLLARHDSVHEPDTNTDPQLMDKAVLALMQGISNLHLSQWDAAQSCFELVLSEARASAAALHSLLHEELGLKDDSLMRQVQNTPTFVQPNNAEVAKASEAFFLLHDKRSGVFEMIREALAAVPGGGQGECACALLRLALTSLEDIQARADSLLSQAADESETRKLRALSFLAATAHDRARLNLSQGLLNLSQFEEAYGLIADRMKACGDKDIEKLEQLDDSLGRSRRDETEDLILWLHNRANEATLQEMLAQRRQQSAYRCLRMFVDAPSFRRRLDKLSAFPWVGCGNTVDSFLRQLNDVGGRSTLPDKEQAEIDATYHARYVFNIARSDYRAAAETMLMHCYNLIAAHVHKGDHVPVEALRKQANSCLVAINCYSLIDPRFAFWIPPSTGPMHLLSGRMRSDSTGKRAMSPSSASQDASTMGWKVTKAEGSKSAPDSLGRSALAAAAAGEDSDGDTLVQLPEGFITLSMLSQHYALLRARVRLAEAQAERRGLRELPMQRIVSLAAEQQRAVAEQTVEELIDFGLLDDAVTVAVQFQLDVEELVRRLTRRCLKAASDLADREVAPILDEQGIEADPWQLLQRYLARLDGTKSVGAGCEGGEEGGKQGGRQVASYAFGRLHRVAGETILSWRGAELPLPPWLKKAMRCGVGEIVAPVRFDTSGADACGLLRLYLRYDHLEDAAQLVCECLELDAPEGSAAEYTLMDLASMRFVPYPQIDQLTHRLERKANHGGAAVSSKERRELLECKEAVEGALKRWLAFTRRESQLVKELCMSETVSTPVEEVLRNAADPLQVAAVDIALLINRVCVCVGQTPAGRELQRVGGDVLKSLCVQMLQRKHPTHAVLPKGKRWAAML